MGLLCHLCTEYFSWKGSIIFSSHRKKLIGLDDLLEDYQKEQKKLDEKKSKRTKIRKVSEAEYEFDDATEARLSECVDKCEKEAQTFISGVCLNILFHRVII